ncbi:TonB-dependent receptor domain-containing protein [Pedobacter hiemivivus]|nr:TonB-dependent receptor [Pedobacter hiemivivus]
MKCSLIVLMAQLTFTGVIWAATANGQNIDQVKVDLKFQQSSLQQSLLTLQKKSGVQISFADQLLAKETKKITLDARQISVREAIKNILERTNLTYRLERDYIIIDAKPIPQRPGRISGKIVDEKGEPLPGASVKLIETGQTVQSSVDGTYQFNVASGNYTIEVSYISFQTKRISDVAVKIGGLTKLDVLLKVASSSLKEVVVKSSFKKESVNGLYVQQKNNASITDGISAEQIAKTPDNNLGQVLKRISGVTTIDTRYVVVRGMTERYNQAMLDGVIIPSTDMNRRNFSFDVVPQELVSNVVVNKTASADLSAEFSGGQILINTLDIPEENFTSIALGTGYNSRTTGKDFVNLGGRTTSDYLGFDNGRRNTPMDLQSWTQRNEPVPSYAMEQSKRFNSEQLKANVSKAIPNQNYRFSLGRIYQLKKDLKIGFSGGLTYRNTQETNPYQTIRNSGFANLGGAQPIDTASIRGEGNLHKFNTTLGGVFNAGLQGEKFKIASKNYYSHVFNETMQDASRYEQDNEFRFKELLAVPEYTTVFQNKLEGENLIGSKGTKFNWSVARTTISQDIKDMRRLRYGIITDVNGVDYYDKPQTNGFSDASGSYDYRLSTRLKETDYNWSASLSQPFNFLNDKSVLKAGYAGWYKERALNSTMVQIIKQEQVLGRPLIGRYEDLMAPERMGLSGDSAFYYADAGRNGTQYTGSSKYHSAYLMLDQRFFKKLRLVYGIRAENFNLANAQEQFLRDPFSSLADSKVDPFVTGEKNWRFLPSVNATYSLTDQMNFRAAYSTTMIRPDFRETSYFELFDPYLESWISGWNVVSTKIKNYDLRYEWYPAAGEIISVSGFYKDFDKPLELVAQNVTGGSGKIRYLRFQNQKKAVNKGFEVEFRKRLGFIADKQWLRNITIFGNGTWMQSKVEALNYTVVAHDGGTSYELVETEVPGVKRPLYGQSPWIINAGLSYDSQIFGANISYNRSDYRSYVVDVHPGQVEYENGRNMVDLQLSTRLLKQKAEIKLNISNLLDAETFFYTNPSGYVLEPGTSGYSRLKGAEKYNAADGDRKTYRVKNGRTASITFSYKF